MANVMGNLQNLKPFPKGVSPNPGGRPRALVEIEEMCRNLTPEVVSALFKIATEGKNEQARVAASSAILDRGWGRARLDVHVEGSGATELLLALEAGRQRVKAISASPVIEATLDD